MKAKFGREILLLSLPFLIIGSVAWWKTRLSDPHIEVEKREVSSVWLNGEIPLTGAQAKRRIHLAAVVNWSPDAVETLPGAFGSSWFGNRVVSRDEKLQATDGRTYSRNDGSLKLDFQVGGHEYLHHDSWGRNSCKLHWLLTIPDDAPSQDLRFSARLMVPGLEPKTIQFLARPVWKTRQPAALTFADVSWQQDAADDSPYSNSATFHALVRFRVARDRTPCLWGRPLASTKQNSPEHAMGATPRVANLIWGQSQWAETKNGQLLMDWRRAITNDQNYNNVDASKPYLDEKGLVAVKYAVSMNVFSPALPARLRAEVGIDGEGILPLDLPIPASVVATCRAKLRH